VLLRFQAQYYVHGDTHQEAEDTKGNEVVGCEVKRNFIAKRVQSLVISSQVEPPQCALRLLSFFVLLLQSCVPRFSCQ
jgi:hypothetical protein